MGNREDLNLISQNTVDFRKKGVSLPSDIAEVTVAGDNLAPAAPTGLTASAVPNGIKLEWTNPSTNADGTTCVDQRWVNIYWKSTTGVSKSSYDGVETIGAKQGTNGSWTDPNITPGTARYYVVTAQDTCGNESTESSEANTSAGSIPAQTTSIPDDASGLIFDDTIGGGTEEGVVTGKGILGVAFQSPDTSWVNFDRYRLWYAVDTGRGFGAWVEIKNVGREGYAHKGLTTTYSYRYKATVLSTDGTESSTPDYAKSDQTGYTPNAADNGSVVAELIFAENIVCTGEVRAPDITVTNLAAINADLGAATAGSFVVGSTNKLWLNDSGDGGLAIGGSTKASAPFRVAADGSLVATSATITGTVTCSAGSSYAGNTIGTSYTTAKCTDANADQTSAHTAADTSAVNGVSASTIAGWRYSSTTYIDGGDIYTGTITANKLNVATLSAISANCGTITAGTINCSAMTISNLNAGSITAGTLSANYINGGTLNFSAISRAGLSVLASELAGSITYDKISSVSASTITTGILTGRTVQTASSGARIVLSTGSTSLIAYDSGGTERVSIDTSTGIIITTGRVILKYGATQKIIISALAATPSIEGSDSSNPISLSNVTGRFTYSVAIVFNSTSPTSWTNLDLSSYVGARRALVLLQVRNAGGSAANYRFRQYGESVEQNSAADNYPGVFSTRCDTSSDYNYVWCMTYTNGYIQWDSDVSNFTVIRLYAYVS